MDVRSQTFLILGISKSGLESARFLLKGGAKCYFYEENTGAKIEKAKAEIRSLGGIEVKSEETDGVLERTDVVVISPGVPINHAVAVKAKAMGKRIIGELELGYEGFTPVFAAITGTNGKTTTATLLDAILRVGGRKSALVGNVGVPLTSALDGRDRETVYVTEVSSFQLESVSEFKPHIACVLNISPDHLERHYNMENYVFLKKRIFANQKSSEYAILNYDDETVRGFYTDIRSKVKWVSVREEVDGAYYSGGGLYYNGEKITEERELAIGG